jgi:hypothetical protein
MQKAKSNFHHAFRHGASGIFRAAGSAAKRNLAGGLARRDNNYTRSKLRR